MDSIKKNFQNGNMQRNSIRDGFLQFAKSTKTANGLKLMLGKMREEYIITMDWQEKLRNERKNELYSNR